MNTIIPWKTLVEIIKPHAPRSEPSKKGRPAFPIETMLRIHFMQQWFGFSDAMMEENLHDFDLYRQFAQLDAGMTRLPDESTILRFRHLLEKHQLAHSIFETIKDKLIEKNLILREGTVIDATLIAGPSSTKNAHKTRDPQMHSTKKGNNYYYGIKAHIGSDAHSPLVHSVQTTPANAHDITQAHHLLHGKEKTVLGDSGYTGIEKRPEIQEKFPETQFMICMRPGKRREIKTKGKWGELIHEAEKIKAKIRAKVEFPFRVLKCQFGYRKTRYKGLLKNTLQIITLFALSNVFIARKTLLAMA